MTAERPTPSAGTLKSALRARYAEPEWAIFFEVADSTGHRASGGYADAVAMGLYPSRGLEVQGFEIKVSRADWRRELKKPHKAEPVFRYCDRWWLVTVPGVVKDGELPPTWGLLEIRKDGKLTPAVPAPTLTAAPIDKTFTAALLRRAGQCDARSLEVLVQERTQDLVTRHAQALAQAREQADRKRDRMQEKARAIQAATGIDMLGWSPPDEVARAIRFVLDRRLLERHSEIQELRDYAARFLAAADAFLAGLDVSGKETIS